MNEKYPTTHPTQPPLVFAPSRAVLATFSTRRKMTFLWPSDLNLCDCTYAVNEKNNSLLVMASTMNSASKQRRVIAGVRIRLRLYYSENLNVASAAFGVNLRTKPILDAGMACVMSEKPVQ
jgi:hypothetical protein